MTVSKRVLSFEEFMNLALYGDGGYYKSEKIKSIRQGDYITSVEVGPLFGAVLARALDGWWTELGEPGEFYVFDVGAGRGTLARSILRANPVCMKALKYVLIEQSEHLASHHTTLVNGSELKESDETVAQKVAVAQKVTVAQKVVVESVLVDSDSSCETSAFGEYGEHLIEHGVVIANELLDNLPTRLLEKTTSSWAEVFVVLDTNTGEFIREELVAADAQLVEIAEKLISTSGANAAPVGCRIPIIERAKDWLDKALQIPKQGRVIVFDYGVLSTQELIQRSQQEWLRTYFAQNQGASPYELVGQQDITCEVSVDQLAAIQQPASIQSQREFLKGWGIDDLVEAGKGPDGNTSAIPTDLKTLELRSRIPEAKALLDPQGLGNHLVLEWEVGGKT